jgi:hypothetical protein
MCKSPQVETPGGFLTYAEHINAIDSCRFFVRRIVTAKVISATHADHGVGRYTNFSPIGSGQESRSQSRGAPRLAHVKKPPGVSTWGLLHIQILKLALGQRGN